MKKGANPFVLIATYSLSGCLEYLNTNKWGKNPRQRVNYPQTYSRIL